LGCVAGSFVLSRFVEPDYRIRLMYPLALLAAAPLLVMALHPGTPAALMLWAISGMGTAYNLPANAVFMRALPNERRGQGFALANAGIITGQGVAVLVAGAAAVTIGTAYVIAAAGAVGVVAVLALALCNRGDVTAEPVAAPVQAVPQVPVPAPAHASV
jgi:predicted MFS family arabinose efflux permease